MKLTVKQAAEVAQVSLSLIYAWVAEHRLAHYRVGRGGKRGQIRIESADLEAFLAALKVEGAPSSTPLLNHLR